MNLLAQSRLTEATSLLRKALAISGNFPSTHPDRILNELSLAGALRLEGKHIALARTLYRQAGRGANERIQAFAGFTTAAQAELRQYRPIFSGQVRAAWLLSERAR